MSTEMNDQNSSIADLKAKIWKFSEDRNWETDNPREAKNYTMALAVEAAELMEILMWKHSEEVADILEQPAEFTHLKEEIADVFWYLIRLCQCLDIDLTQAVCDKAIKNVIKYPPLK